MYRFVDLRFQGTQNRFAFWDTTINRFREYDGEQAWATFDDLELAFVTAREQGSHAKEYELTRMRALCPAWVFIEPTDEELEFREGE